ncbi:Imm26 family immunity protein [Xanthomonas oryzae]|uniref:Imm26 family immunity protein n=2 Tax=Xanthomonas oryzae TaxID=347 RepID=UPI00096E6201|nr:Imm26 family immunity protein [Xanthomonas oryzae]UNW43523.1 hypothetical protein H4J00_05750 [Xanthomonas oryzae pv. oryzicola]
MFQKGKKLSLSVGDIFAVPLRGRGYGFGRLLYMEGKWRLAEFFSVFKSSHAYSDSIVESGRLIPVHNIMTFAIEAGDWPLIGHNPGFFFNDIDDLIFYKGLKDSRQFFKKNGELLSPDEAKALPSASSMPQSAEYISDLLWDKLVAEGRVELDSID